MDSAERRAIDAMHHWHALARASLREAASPPSYLGAAFCRAQMRQDFKVARAWAGMVRWHREQRPEISRYALAIEAMLGGKKSC